MSQSHEPRKMTDLEKEIVKESKSDSYMASQDLKGMRGTLLFGGLALAAAGVVLAATSASKTKQAQKRSLQNCPRVQHDTLRVYVESHDEDDWSRTVRTLFDEAFCPDRVWVTIVVPTRSEARQSVERMSAILGSRYKQYARQVEVVAVDEHVSIRKYLRCLASSASGSAKTLMSARYSLFLSAMAHPLPDWDQNLVEFYLHESTKWRSPLVITAPLGLSQFAAFYTWAPSGAPIPRFEMLSDAANSSTPFVGLTAWLSPEMVFSRTDQLRLLAGNLASTGFWRSREDEWADRYRFATTAFETNTPLSTLKTPMFALYAEATKPKRRQAANSKNFLWPATPNWSHYSGIDPSKQTITPAAAIGLVNLLTTQTLDWQKNAQKNYMSAQMVQRCGSVREAQRRVALLQPTVQNQD
jgi:hypothetical protein